MKMNARSTLLAIVFLSLFMRPCSLGRTPDRDLCCYENGGLLDINPIQGKQALQGVSKLRKFLWKHWTERRRGVIATIVHPIDYNSSKVVYFIEPNEHGMWQVIIESQRKSLSGWSKNIERIVASEVKRVEIAHDGWSERVEIPQNANRRPESYHLLLKDQRGQFLEEF
jgi:hypothetical protein